MILESFNQVNYFFAEHNSSSRSVGVACRDMVMESYSLEYFPPARVFDLEKI